MLDGLQAEDNIERRRAERKLIRRGDHLPDGNKSAKHGEILIDDDVERDDVISLDVGQRDGNAAAAGTQISTAAPPIVTAPMCTATAVIITS